MKALPSCIFAGALVASVLVVSSSSAQGMLDFADPCKGAEKEFASTSEALRQKADAIIADWDSRTDPPGEIRGLYVEAVRTAAFQAWSQDPTILPMLDTLKKADPNFDPMDFFLKNIYVKVLTPEKEAELIRDVYKVDYQTKLRPQFVADRANLENQINTQKSELDSSCKPDVFSQVMRSTFGRAILIVSGNFDAAKNESGEIAKAVRAISGISLTDIQEHGILGGPGSDLRKALGGNSDLAKAVDQLSKVLNPLQWKVDLPKIEVKVEPPPPIELGTVGGHRVCVPWC